LEQLKYQKLWYFKIFLTFFKFEEFLNEITDKYSHLTYNLLTNNCNNFSDACVEFLTGSGLPKWIIGKN